MHKQLLRSHSARRKWMKRISRLCMCVAMIFGFSKCCSCQDISAPRFFKFNYQSLSTPTQPLNVPTTLNRQLENENNYLIEASLRFPVRMGERTQVLGQLGFHNEFAFGYFSNAELETEEVELFSYSGGIIVRHELKNGLTITNATEVSSQGSERTRFSRTAWNYSNFTLLEKNINNGKVGLGVAAAYCNRARVLPIIRYQKQLGEKWALDIFLPVKLEATRRISKNSQLSFGIKGEAGQYALDQQDFGGLPESDLSFNRISIRGTVGYERQISKLVGMAVEAGICAPYRMGIFARDNSATLIHNFNDRITPHVNVGLFMSVPR